MQVESVQPVTARLPGSLYEQVRRLAEEDGVSINQVVVSAVERYVRQAERDRAIQAAAALREELRKKYGTQPDSAPLIRRMREERHADLR